MRQQLKKGLQIFLSLLGALSVLTGALLVYAYAEPNVLHVRIVSPNDEMRSLQYAGDMPVLVVHEEGYAAGLIEGSVFKDEIRSLITILNDEALSYNAVERFFVKAYLLIQAKRLDHFIPQVYREEMQGVADGARVSYNDILVLNTYDDLFYLAGCSSFVAPKGERSEEFIHARNLDYDIPALAGNNVLMYFSKTGTLTIGFPGYVGALTATNRSGITLGSHTSVSATSGRGIPTGILYRFIIDRAESIEDVDRILRESKRTIGNILVVSSVKENRVAVFEFTDKNIAAVEGDPCAASTNHFSDETMAKEQAETESVMFESNTRLSSLRALCVEDRRVTFTAVRDLFSYADGNDDLWTTIANEGTVQSVIFLPEKEVLYLAQGKTPPVTDEGYARFDYGRLFRGEERSEGVDSNDAPCIYCSSQDDTN